MVFFQNSLIKKYCFLAQVDVFLSFSAKILVNLCCLNGKCEVSNINVKSVIFFGKSEKNIWVLDFFNYNLMYRISKTD